MSMESSYRSPIEDLYQEVILDHNRNPRNFRSIQGNCHHEHAYNPLCGDDYELYILLEGNNVKDISFIGKGCAISKSSASMMTKAVKGLDVTEALEIQSSFLDLILKGREKNSEAAASLGSLTIFEGVGKFPVRVKCATMIWHALGKILKENNIKGV